MRNTEYFNDLFLENELRNGNWIQTPATEFHPLIRIQLCGYETGYQYEDRDQPFTYEFSRSSMQPIPLSEAWLLNVGFVQDPNGNYWKDLGTLCLELIQTDAFYPALVQYPELSSEEEQRVCLKSITSLHELQNLYFTLTGEELEVDVNNLPAA